MTLRRAYIQDDDGDWGWQTIDDPEGGVGSTDAADVSVSPAVAGATNVEDALVALAAAGGGSSPVLEQAFSLTAQQLKDSTLTPVEIIPAQGAGTLVVPTMFVFNFQAGATPFTSSGDLELVYGVANLNSLATSMLTGSDLVWYTHHALSSGWAEGGDPADYLNQPVKLRAALRGSIVAAEPTGFPGGVDYAVGDTGTIDDGSPNATYEIAAEASGVPTVLTITDGGDGYNLAASGFLSEWTTTPGGAQPGIGSGLVAGVTAVDASGSAGDGTLSGIVYYLVADLS